MHWMVAKWITDEAHLLVAGPGGWAQPAALPARASPPPSPAPSASAPDPLPDGAGFTPAWKAIVSTVRVEMIIQVRISCTRSDRDR
jgi:hypothetical protein